MDEQLLMKRPKSVRVMGKTYRLIWDCEDLEEDMSAGDHSQRHLAIRVAARYAEEEQRETVLHELCHAVEHQLGLDLEEEQVRQMSVGLFAIFQDNPGLVAYLWSKKR